MHALRIAISIVWAVFWIGWLGASFTAKRSSGRRRSLRLNGVAALAVVLLLRLFRGSAVAVHSPVLAAIGAVLLASGIALSVWARMVLGRNWGMPMTQKAEPELVTAGPYRLIRHPIYSGLLLAFVGTALATSLFGLAIAAVLGGYFVYSATVEERNLSATFPTTYPAYRQATRMLIPFVL